jgi:hypothetical protein
MSTKTYTKIPGEQLTRKRKKNTEELQLHHNHEKIMFLTVLLLFAQ